MAKKQDRKPSIIQATKEAYYIAPGQPTDNYMACIMDPHEPIGGRHNRDMSIEEGIYIYVPRWTHDWLHENPVGQQVNKLFKAIMQEEWLKFKVYIEDYTWTDAWDEWKEKFTDNYTDYDWNSEIHWKSIDVNYRVECLLEEVA